MLTVRHCILALLVGSLAVPLDSNTMSIQGTAQATVAVQPATLFQQSLAAQIGKATVSDITLSGTVRRIVGPDDETGTVTLQALSSGAARLDLSLPSGNAGEVRNNSEVGPVGSWYGPDGLLHPVTYHNALTDPAWFFPVFALSRALTGNQNVITYVGRETRDGKSVEHFAVSQATSVPLLARLSQVDYYLDSATLLPSNIAFNVHADNNALLDIPVEISLSDYRAVNGIQVPFHIQKFFNGSLQLDIQLSTVSVNSGLQSSAFSVQ